MVTAAPAVSVSAVKRTSPVAALMAVMAAVVASVIAECAAGLNTLIDYRYQQHFKAASGQGGQAG